MTVVALLRDGRIIAQAAISLTAIAGNTPTAVSATVPDLKKIEYLLSTKLSSVGNVTFAVSGTSISGNAVGVTVIPGATGITVSGEFLAIGY
jgi:hypothetical protein